MTLPLHLASILTLEESLIYEFMVCFLESFSLCYTETK